MEATTPVIIAYQWCTASGYTVNWEIFVVKIFLDSKASAKIKRTEIMCIINDNVVWGRLSENYLFIPRNICEAKYS